MIQNRFKNNKKLLLERTNISPKSIGQQLKLIHKLLENHSKTGSWSHVGSRWHLLGAILAQDEPEDRFFMDLKTFSPKHCVLPQRTLTFWSPSKSERALRWNAMFRRNYLCECVYVCVWSRSPSSSYHPKGGPIGYCYNHHCWALGLRAQP